MKKFLLLVMAALLAFPMTAFAANSEEAMMKELQKQIADLSEELEELSDRLDGAERHSVLDRIEFSGDLRSKAHSIHYQDVTFNPGINVDFQDFFEKLAPATVPNPNFLWFTNRTKWSSGWIRGFNPMVPTTVT